MESLTALMEEDWRWQLRDNPEYASQAGVHQFDDKLQDLSPAAFAARTAHNQQMLARLGEIERASLPARGRLFHSLFQDDLEGETEAIRLGCHLFPVNSIGMGGVHHNFVETLQWAEADPSKFVARLEASPGSKAAGELVETVLAMDDFVRFKAMMLQLKEEVVEEEVMARFSRGDRAL